MDSGCIKQSTKAKGDAVFGNGVYLTSIPPDAPKSKIVQNNWDGMRNVERLGAKKTQACIKVPKAWIPGVTKQQDKLGRDIWLYPGDINLYKMVKRSTPK